MGVQAKRIYKGQNIDVFRKPVSKDHDGREAVALAFLNKRNAGTKAVFKLSDLGLMSKTGFRATDIFSGEDLGSFKPEDTFRGDVKPTGILMVNFLSQK